MDWSIVAGIIALATFIITIVKTILPLNSTITKLVTLVDALQKNHDQLITKNSESHGRLWEHNDKQDARLDDHEKRITVIERKE